MGLTMLELLVVLALIATLMGVGVGVFGDLRLGKQAAPGLVKNALRSARSLAIAQGAPSRVLLDRKGRALRVLGLRPIGMWHFEDEALEGAFRIQGALHGGEIDPQGRLGACVRFGSSGERWVELPVAGLPSYHVPEGIAVEFDLFLDRVSGAVLVQRPGAFLVSLTPDGRIRGAVHLEGTTAEGGGRNQAETRPDVVQLGRWHRVVFFYDRQKIRILVDGVEEAAVEEGGTLRSPGESMLVGDTQLPFEGKIDELRVAAVVAGEAISLPKGVEFGPGPEEIRFDASGNLDPAAHPGPATLALQYEEGRQTPFEVGIYGTIR